MQSALQNILMQMFTCVHCHGCEWNWKVVSGQNACMQSERQPAKKLQSPHKGITWKNVQTSIPPFSLQVSNRTELRKLVLVPASLLGAWQEMGFLHLLMQATVSSLNARYLPQIKGKRAKNYAFTLILISAKTKSWWLWIHDLAILPHTVFSEPLTLFFLWAPRKTQNKNFFTAPHACICIHSGSWDVTFLWLFRNLNILNTPRCSYYRASDTVTLRARHNATRAHEHVS